MIDNQSLYIPYESISLDSTQLSSATLLFDPSSNGLASGNTTAEAICHALCELIERDAEFKFNQLTEEKQQTQLLNLTSIDSVLIQSLLKKLQDTYVSVQIWDMMSDIGLPAFCCTIFDQDISRKTQIFSGQGCHLNKEVALCRAITEAIQVRLTFISGSRDDVFPAYYEKEMIANLSLLNNGTQDYTKISHIKYSFNFEENIKIISQQLHRCRYEKQCLIQHTSDNSLISVVQVIVPKLRRKEG